jgi:integrase
MVLRKGLWSYRTTVNGKRRTFATGMSDLKLAEKAVVKLQSTIDNGTLDEFIEKKKVEAKAVLSYRAMGQKYLDEVTVLKNFDGAHDVDTNNLRPSMNYFDTTPITDITRVELTAFMVSLRKLVSARKTPYAPNCIRNFITGCRTVFGYAVRTKELGRNPWVDVEKTVKKALTPPETTKDRTISQDEQDAFLEHADAEMARAFTVFMFTGIREDELLRLRPEENCDFANFVLKLTGRVVKGKGNYSPTQVVREIPMYPCVVLALQQQWDARKDGLGVRGQKGRPTGEGKRKQGPELWNMSGTTLSNRMKEIREAAELASWTEHDQRRTFATRCADADVNPMKLQSWMGHKDIKTTMTFYVKTRRKESRAALLRLDIGAPVAPVPIEMGREDVAGA